MPPQSIIKPIAFAVVSRAGAAVCFVLAFVWLAMPEVVLGLWQVEAVTAALVVARRNAAVCEPACNFAPSQGVIGAQF